MIEKFYEVIREGRAGVAATAVDLANYHAGRYSLDGTNYLLRRRQREEEHGCQDEHQRKTKISGAMNLKLLDRKSTRLNSSHIQKSRMPSSA